MSNHEKAAIGIMATGYLALIAGVAAFSPPVAAIVGGVLLLAFGIVMDKAAS